MKYILFTQENGIADDLYPFSLTRKVQDFRFGILTIREKWERSLNANSFDISNETEYKAFHEKLGSKDLVYVIQANVLPIASLLSQIKKLKPAEAICNAEGKILVGALDKKSLFNSISLSGFNKPVTIDNVICVQYGWHIFQLNRAAIEYDFALITKGKRSAAIHHSNKIINRKNVFIEKGASVKHCMINAEEGPVYIGKNALLMEGCLVRGPVSIGENAVVKMGAKIYGATTIGPGCTVGGEIKNTVFFEYSNKAHDGYLGDSVIGAWCNLGAGTSNSNLKNTAGNITVHLHGKKYNAGQKCGVLMGDFSRTAINTAINSGTTIGVSANVFGNGLTPKYIPSFSWGYSDTVKYSLDKVLEDANRWKELKGQQLTGAEKENLTNIYKQI